MAAVKQRRRGHDPGVAVRDLAAMLADGGECVADLGAQRDQQALFGPVASDSAVFRVVDRVASTTGRLDALRAARARARERFWELQDAPQRLTLYVDATLITAHSEKENAAGTTRAASGFTRCRSTWMRPTKRSAACSRPGNAGSNTADDHVAVLDLALAQIPAEYVEGLAILVRADSAGATHGLVDYCRGGSMRFSVGYELTETVRQAILEIPEDAWVPGLDQDGSARDNGEVCEITDSVDLSAWPEGCSVIVRRERPHPGAQLSFTDHDGYRFQAILTDQTNADIAVQECRHRQHAHVEDRIRYDKDTGLSKFPFKEFALNEVWLEIVALAHDPDRLDPSAPRRRPPRQGRAQATALPAAARRRPARVLRPPREAPPPEHMAPGGRAPRRVPETQDADARHRLTPAASDPHHHPAAASRPAGRDHRCPETGRAHSGVPAGTRHRQRHPTRSPIHKPPTRQTAPCSHSHAPTARSGLTAESALRLTPLPRATVSLRLTSAYWEAQRLPCRPKHCWSTCLCSASSRQSDRNCHPRIDF